MPEVVLDRPRDHVALVRINRPEALNALNNAAMPPIAVAQIKEVLIAGQDAPLETALILGRKAFQILFDSEDRKEGMRAFLEKRKPVYEGR